MSHVKGYINPLKFHAVAKKLRSFCYGRGFIETHPQCRRHIMPACEDPTTVTSYRIGKQKFPLPQTGQMGLEDDILENPSLGGVFCMTTSYRNEPNPKPRHDLTFPMFEFETKGNFDGLVNFCSDLLRFLGYTCAFHEVEYDDVCKQYGVKDLDHEHEELLSKELGPVVFLKNFPIRTDPFWNMSLNESGSHAKKLDVILSGVETIGSAERSCNVDLMRYQFKTISNGQYAQLLHREYGVDRVTEELERYLQHKMIPRFGGGIGVTRLIKALEKEGLLDES